MYVGKFPHYHYAKSVIQLEVESGELEVATSIKQGKKRYV
jgi:hypothetical protein